MGNASTMSLTEMQTLRPLTELLHQHLHFNKIPRRSLSTLRSEKHLFRIHLDSITVINLVRSVTPQRSYLAIRDTFLEASEYELTLLGTVCQE